MIALKALAALRHWTLDINILMTIAVGGDIQFPYHVRVVVCVSDTQVQGHLGQEYEN